jgi:RimJ/RimL family protein N-acetyltransferase
MTRTLTTPRLLLRPPRPADAPRVQALCGNWNVARMLGRVPYPYPDGLAESWIAEQGPARQNGSANDFAIELAGEPAGELVGVVGIERRKTGDHVLGYWLGEPWWGQGLMGEAVTRIIRFAREEMGVTKVAATYLADNPASGRILAKCGFRVQGRGPLPCLARGNDVDGVTTVLHLGTVDQSAAVS